MSPLPDVELLTAAQRCKQSEQWITQVNMINLKKILEKGIRRHQFLKKQRLRYLRKQQYFLRLNNFKKFRHLPNLGRYSHSNKRSFIGRFLICWNQIWKDLIQWMERLSYWQILGSVLAAIFILGVLMPEPVVIPVEGAKPKDWHKESFWYAPWGPSGVHKGIDIFAKRGQRVVSSTPGLVIYTGEFLTGGNIIYVLGPHWKIHYYAHLQKIYVPVGRFLRAGEIIGANGSTGNARGKQPHLHYSVMSLIPHFWRSDDTEQGWKKVFYLDPGREFLKVYSQNSRKKRFSKKRRKKFLATFSKK